MNEEILKKLAGGGKSPEEVLAIAKEYGKEITPEQAQALYDKLKASANGELSDDALDAVAGGVELSLSTNCFGCGAVYKISEFKQNGGCCPNCGAPRF